MGIKTPIGCENKPITMDFFTDKAFDTPENENNEEEIVLRQHAMDLKFICLALELKWINGFDAKKKIDFLGISLKDDWAFPKTSSTLAAFTGEKMDCKDFKNWKKDFLKHQEKLQKKLCICMFDYYDQDGDGIINKKELAMLFKDIGDNNDDERFWSDPQFLDICMKRLGKLDKVGFTKFYDSVINSDMAYFHDEICFEREHRKEKYGLDHLYEMMKDLKLESKKNIIKDIEETYVKINDMMDSESLKDPLLKFLDLKSTGDDEKDFEMIGNIVEGGIGITYILLNICFNYYDSDKKGYLVKSDLENILKDQELPEDQREERLNQIINNYYDEYLGDVVTFYNFSKVFNQVFKERGVKMNIGDDSEGESGDEGNVQISIE